MSEKKNQLHHVFAVRALELNNRERERESAKHAWQRQFLMHVKSRLDGRFVGVRISHSSCQCHLL